MTTKRIAASALATLLIMAAAVFAASPSASAFTITSATVFINEIHYDNDGTDAGEAVEIAGPAGTDLSSWSLVPYNGSGASYTPVVNLSGTIPNQQNGYGALSFQMPGLQNGSPDGIALVNNTTVVQFLSYEGSFTAVGGPANGLVSTDIGVAETGTTPLGHSLQLTGNGTTYGTFAWNSPTTDTFGALNNAQTFTVGDTAPTVTSTRPMNNANNIAPSANLAVAFSETVSVNDTWFTISCTNSSTHSAVVSGGPTTYTIDPETDFVLGETCTVTIIGSKVVDQDGEPTVLAQDYSWSFVVQSATACAAYTPIYTIQGSGASSPYAGDAIEETTRGVVTADFQGSSGLNGFFVQDPQGDAKAATSDGIFIYVPATNPSSSIDVAVGDLVLITGQVKEFNTFTQFDNVSTILKCDTTSVPAPTVVDLPEPVNGDLERLEGMLVTFPETLTVAQNFFQGRYGQLTLSAEGRLYNPTNLYRPGSPEASALADANARRLLVLDDTRSSQNPNPIPYIGDNGTLRAGDTVAGLTGVLDFGLISSSDRRDYRLQPTAQPIFNRVNQRTAAPEPVGGNVKVASFNVLNYFTTIDQTGASCFPSGTRSDCRGADSVLEFARQRAKVVAAIKAIDADILGLIELENNGATAVNDLVSALNEATAFGTYAAISDPATGVGDDAIKVALIYKPDRVVPSGPSYSRADPIFDRLPVAQTFVLKQNGGRFSVVVNHLKSKGSCPAAGDPNADQGDGQGCWNAKRVDQAQSLLTFVDTLRTTSGDPDVLVLGDLNAYGKEDPIITLANGGLIDQIAKRVQNPYSYVFDGQAGYLDHALTTASLDQQVTGMTEWHINADEPSVIDYNTEFKPQDLYTATPYRSSDHDPVIIGLQLRPGMSKTYLPTVNSR